MAHGLRFPSDVLNLNPEDSMSTQLTDPETSVDTAGRLAGRRILFVLGWLERGGSERQAIVTARHLRDVEGAEVAVWGFSCPGAAIALCEQYQIPWRYYPFEWTGNRWRRLAALWRLAKDLRVQRPDALLPYCAPPNVACGLIWRFTGAKVCVWNQRDAGLSLAGSRWERWAVRASSVVVSNTAVQADVLAGRHQLNRDRMLVVPNGVDLPAPEATGRQWRERLELGSEDFVACMIAHVHLPKDHPTLLRAWRIVVDRLAEDRRRAVLLLAGRTDKADQAKAVAYDLELGRHVRFLDCVTDVAGLLDAADLGVHSSKNEGCPNGLLECMAAGLPVVGTDIPGIREAVGVDNFPWLAPLDDHQTLAELIVRMANEGELHETLGAANRARIEEVFSIDGLRDRMTELLVGQLNSSKRDR